MADDEKAEALAVRKNSHSASSTSSLDLTSCGGPSEVRPKFVVLTIHCTYFHLSAVDLASIARSSLAIAHPPPFSPSTSPETATSLMSSSFNSRASTSSTSTGSSVSVHSFLATLSFSLSIPRLTSSNGCVDSTNNHPTSTPPLGWPRPSIKPFSSFAPSSLHCPTKNTTQTPIQNRLFFVLCFSLCHHVSSLLPTRRVASLFLRFFPSIAS